MFTEKTLADLLVIVAIQSGKEQSEDEKFKALDLEAYCPGGFVEIISLLQEVLKFRLNFTYVEDINFQNQKNMHWNVNQHIIYCYPPFEDFSKNFVLLFPTFQSRLAALYKSSNLPKEKDLFVRNVTGNLWLYLAGTLVLLTVFLRLSTHIHHRLKPRHDDWSWLEVIQWSLGAICQQGSQRHPQGCSCRTMFLIGYMITYMIYTGFAAGITSLLAVSPDTVSLPWHMVLHSQLPLTALCDSHADRYLKEKVEDSDNVRYLGCVKSFEELRTGVEDSSVAVMSERSVTHYMTYSASEEERCAMSTSLHDHHYHYTGLLVERNSPLRKPFNYWLLRFKELGLLKRVQGKWLKPAPACQTAPSYTQVGFKHVQSAFLIIQSCGAVALVLLTLERLLNGYKKNTLHSGFHLK